MFSRLKMAAAALALSFVAACSTGNDTERSFSDNDPPPDPSKKCSETVGGAHDLYEGSSIVGPRTIPKRKENKACIDEDESVPSTSERDELRVD